MLITNLRDPAIRQPQVVVGGAGAGKTTLLVQLTKLLAERGAFPVPISLRDARDNLDFRTLALDGFLRATTGAVTQDPDSVRIWRQLCDEDKVVVLADGLEEAVIEADRFLGRDYTIRLAILQAAEQGLPLIVTSRPHSPLRQMPASVVQLESLSEEAILEYLQQDAYVDDRRFDSIVEIADLAKEPVYLRITRQLERAGLLDHLASRDGGLLDARLVDQAEVRVRLLNAWIEALIDGHLAAEAALASNERAAIVEQLSVLACIGIQHDRLVVTFDDFERLSRKQHPVIEEARRRLAYLGRGVDIRWAAIRGTQLGLVEARGDGVLFQRSLLQAYLGSRLIGAAMEDPEYRREALDWLGREFLMALVMRSRARVEGPGPSESTGSTTPAESSRARDWQLQDLLVEKAMRRDDAKVLDLYAAALQIDCVDRTPVHNRIAERLAIQWPRVHTLEPRSLEEAKLNLVHRFGEAIRTIAERYPQVRQDSSAKRGKGEERPGQTIRPAYMQLYRISCLESSDYIRMAGAQEIGAGGDEAFGMLEGVLGPRDNADLSYRGAAPKVRKDTSKKTGTRQQSGNGVRHEDQGWKELIFRAWLAPLLAGSAINRAGEARRNLDRWLRFVNEPTPAGEYSDRLPLEVALAQGFKYAANRRRHPQAPEARFYLLGQATEMLRISRFWFSQLTLLHALCLWELPDFNVERQARLLRELPGTVVSRWADMLERPHHPFVTETLRLVTWALETGLPERFIWIDEKDVANTVGSYPTHLRSVQKRKLWIPRSTGWAVLHPRAQELLADVLLLLNMAERGQQGGDYGWRLQRINRNDLPPCLTRDRNPLDPGGTVGGPHAAPGSNCVDGCPFELCPYPPKREASFRTELSESFCLRQKTLMRRRLTSPLASPWQEIPSAYLRQFWAQMARRARG